MKRRESVQDENSNQVVWRFIHTKPTCSTRILHRLFKSGNSICTLSSVFLNCQQMLLFFLPKRLFVSHFFPFFLFWRLVISHEQSWLLDNMKQVSILYRLAVDLFGLELNWWPGLFTICVASSSKVNDWGVLLIHVLRRISQLYVTAQPLESYNVFIILAAVL